MPETPPDPLAPPARPRLRRVGRWLFALAFVALPMLGVAGLGALWARSCRVEESWLGQFLRDGYDPVTRFDGRTNLDLLVISSRGLLSLEVDRTTSGERIDDLARERAALAERADRLAQPGPRDPAGWTWSHETHEPGGMGRMSYDLADLPGLCGIEERLDYAGGEGPGNLLGLPRDDGALRPLMYFARAADRDLADHDRVQVVGPFWAWMLPLAVPPAWWLGCPPGRILPRLTLRRAAVAVAAAGLVLGLLRRSPATDRAILTFREYGAERFYGDAAGSGRSILAGVGLCRADMNDRVNGLMPRDAARLRSALADSPGLRYLAFRGVVGYEGIEADLLPPGLPELASLDLRESSLDDAALARLADFPNLRRLALTRSRHITDAGLTHLRRLPGLTHLWLGELALTDAGLDHLSGLPHLRVLHFEPNTAGYPPRPCQLTAPALRRLADSLPALEELTCPDGTVLTRRPARPGPGPEEP